MLSIEKPSDVEVGDIMLVTIAEQENKNKTIPISIGWSLVKSVDIEGKGEHARGTILYKFVTAADAVAKSYSFTLGLNSKNGVGAIVAFFGVDTTNPFDAIGEIVKNDKDSNATTTAITTVTPNAAVIMFGMSKKDIEWSDWNAATPGDLEELFDYQEKSGASVGGSWSIKSFAGSTGIGSVQLKNDRDKEKKEENTGVILLALRSSGCGITNKWNGSKWSIEPLTSSQQIIFQEDYTSIDSETNAIVGCSCQVNEGKTVTILSGHSLIITNELNVVGTGKLIFENNASLVQINDNAANAGNITYNRETNTAIPIKKTDYVYWSTPVSENLNSTSAAPKPILGEIQTGTLYYSFNDGSWTREYEDTQMETGKGYIVRGEGTWFDKGSASHAPSFYGAPNNGVKQVDIVGRKSNLIGNPYPSAIDGDAFILANSGDSSASLSGTLYFWTHGSEIQARGNIDATKAGSGAYAYTSDDYSTYTLTGGVGVTGTIAAGQAFFAPATSGGGIAIFNNSMRLSSSGKILDNTQFLKSAGGAKSAKTISTNKLDKNRIWLNLTNTGGAFKQTLIGYITGATNAYESAYDGNSFNGNAFVDFYSINEDKNLAIQGRALPFDENDVVPLGYKSKIAGDFKIAIDQVDGFLVNNRIFLEDKLLEKIQDLSEAPYDFSTEVGTFNDRFILTYSNKTLATADFQTLENQVVISNKNKEIKISTSVEIIDKVFIYDFLGRQIYQKTDIATNELVISNLIQSNQALIVKVVLQNAGTVSQKLIY
jgi:hypothetical protein